jgi:hypothetical protein
MRFAESICSEEDFHTNYEQHENFNYSSKRLLHIPRLLFLLSHKINVDHSGPFWPIGFPIKYPTPSYLSRTSDVKYSSEYYHILGSSYRQTYDNQPSMYKYTDPLKHSTVVYDMDKSSRLQHIKQNDNEHLCPPLIFEARFEGGNLRQVKRV